VSITSSSYIIRETIVLSRFEDKISCDCSNFLSQKVVNDSEGWLDGKEEGIEEGKEFLSELGCSVG
jgi:hypothetical protein